MLLNPGHARAIEVKAWYSAGGAAMAMPLGAGGGGGGAGGAVGPRKTIAAVAAENIGTSQQPTVWSVRATLALFKPGKELWYTACPKCKKKATGDDAQGWACEACQWSGAECTRRYVGRFQILDAEGEGAGARRRALSPCP